MVRNSRWLLIVAVLIIIAGMIESGKLFSIFLCRTHLHESRSQWCSGILQIVKHVYAMHLDSRPDTWTNLPVIDQNLVVDRNPYSSCPPASPTMTSLTNQYQDQKLPAWMILLSTQRSGSTNLNNRLDSATHSHRMLSEHLLKWSRECRSFFWQSQKCSWDGLRFQLETGMISMGTNARIKMVS